MREYQYIPCVLIGLLVAVSLPSGAEPVADAAQEPVLGVMFEACEVETPVQAEPIKPNVKTKKQKKKSRVKGLPLSNLTVTLADFGNANWQYPISPARTAGSGFGRRESPINKGRWSFHGGQDIGCRTGERIYAAADGVIRTSMYSATAGNFVVIKHADHEESLIETRYLHLSRRHVRRGKSVRAGDVIGRCGDTGQSTSPHLHFEVKKDGKTVSPFRIQTPSEKTSFSDNIIGGPNDILNAECPLMDSGSGTAQSTRHGEHSRL